MTLQTYIAEGFMEDCEELIYRLTQKFQKVDWHKFCHCWKEMEFDILFYGRQSVPEVVEFTEELLQTARLYIVTETDNIESQIIGVFIAYAITIIQPYKNLCSLRLVPKDIPALYKIEDLARRENRKDVLMILGKLYLYGRTQFHVSQRERAMDMAIRKYFDGSTNVPPCIARRWHGRLDRHRVTALEDIANWESKYMDLKMRAKMIADDTFPGTDVKVDMFKPEAKHMAESLRKLISNEGNRDVSEGASYVSTVKQKAMKNVVDPMKHLHGLTDRQKEKEKNADAQKPSATKSKSKNRSGKLPSPEHNEEPFLGFSLPSLDDPPDGEVLKRVGSPEPPFKGFTAEEIKQSDYIKKGKNTKATSNGKGKGVGKSSTPTEKTKAAPTNKGNNTRSPGFNAKRKSNTEQDTTKKKKKKYKNKLNKKLRLCKDFNSDDSNTYSDNSYTSETEEPNEPATKSLESLDHEPANVESQDIATDACKGKELTIQSRGVVKHFVEFEVSDIVIRTERDAPAKDIEIEYIDNYTGANAYEEMCEVSDDEDSRKDKRKQRNDVDSDVTPKEVNVTIEECDEFGDTRDDDGIEVFQIVEDSTESIDTQNTYPKDKGKIYRNKTKSKQMSERQDQYEAVKKILGKNKMRSVERRRLKQPNLRSKLKKMGLLPVANFDDDSN